MDRLRRSLRNSFRRRNGNGPLNERRNETNAGRHSNSSDDPNKSPMWSQDEASVRAGTCSFKVKYLGSVEVYESRGMQVCEEALRVLRNARRRRVKAILYVSGDSLRVVDKESKGLIVDQTIEKVSFCAPDRQHEKGFAYICRDGTTRRWICYGFHARKDTGERLSHSVGCAFAVCLEKKQKRDRDSQRALTIQKPVQPTPATTTDAPTVTIRNVMDHAPSTSDKTYHNESAFQRNSYRYSSLQERLQDPQTTKPTEKPPVKPAVNLHAVARPRGNYSLFERQGSLRGPMETHVGMDSGNPSTQTVPPDDVKFRRFNSLRVNQLPSNIARVAGTTNCFESGIAEEESPPPTSPRAEDVGYQNASSSMSSPSGSSGKFSPANLDHQQHGQSRGAEWLQTTATQAKFWQQYRAVSPTHPPNGGEQSGTPVSTISSTSREISANQPPPFPPPPLPAEPTQPSDTAECGSPAWTTFDDTCRNSTDLANRPTTPGQNSILSNTFSSTNPFCQESSAVKI